MNEIISFTGKPIASKCCFYGLQIKRNCSNEPPYIELQFKDKRLTRLQKELIYRLHFDYLYNHYVNEDILDYLTKFVIEKNYNSLFEKAVVYNYTLVPEYLLSYDIVNICMDHWTCPINLPNKLNIYQESWEYYFSLINENTVKQMPNLFNIAIFSKYIKFSEEFIDSNFNRFTCADFRTGYKNVFLYIGFQQPSFDTLVNHIEEFIIDELALKTYLNEGEVNELKLIQSIKGAPH